MSALAPAIKPRRSILKGWPLFGLNALFLTVIMLTLLIQHGLGIEAVRIVVRTTAQTSLFFFCIAFSASSLYALMPNMLTRWIRENRRYFGVSFAYSHFLHAIGLYAFATLDPHSFAEHATTAMFVFGGTAYGFIVLMTLTSFDTTAALIGRRAWQLLHTTGAYYIWMTFMVSEGRRAVVDTYYWPFVGALLFVMGLRLLAGRKKRNYQPS
jgi:methionine sulfoxide reductase heme-binding subunit